MVRVYSILYEVKLVKKRGVPTTFYSQTVRHNLPLRKLTIKLRKIPKIVESLGRDFIVRTTSFAMPACNGVGGLVGQTTHFLNLRNQLLRF